MSEQRRLPKDKLKVGEATRLDGPNGGICLVRLEDGFHALGDRCSHADVSLSEGDVDTEERTVECWMHGSVFSVVDGKPLCLPATKPVPVYSVEEDGDEVVVTFK